MSQNTRGGGKVNTYQAYIAEVKALVESGVARMEAITTVAEQHGIRRKGLQAATYRYAPELASRRPVNGVSAGRTAGNIVREAEQVLELAQRACEQIDNLQELVRARDKEIARLQKELEKGKEATELGSLHDRFRQASHDLRKHLPAMAQTGG